MDNGTRIITELSVASVTLSAFFDAIPAVAALVGAIYYGIQIWETKTIKEIRERWKSKS